MYDILSHIEEDDEELVTIDDILAVVQLIREEKTMHYKLSDIDKGRTLLQLKAHQHQ
jgi:hypothetical protein